MDQSTVLTPEAVVEALNSHAEELRKLGVAKIGLFGSQRRGEARPDSDIDILVTLKRPSFNDYMDIKLYLEGVFGRTVDLVLEESLRPELRPVILSEVMYASHV